LQYTLQKTIVYTYIELWYFTKDSCFEAMKQAQLQSDDAFGLLSANKVLTLGLVTSVKALKNAKADYKLSLMEILQAWTFKKCVGWKSTSQHSSNFSGT
jgi:hypothetical protein